MTLAEPVMVGPGKLMVGHRSGYDTGHQTEVTNSDNSLQSQNQDLETWSHQTEDTSNPAPDLMVHSQDTWHQSASPKLCILNTRCWWQHT